MGVGEVGQHGPEDARRQRGTVAAATICVTRSIRAAKNKIATAAANPAAASASPIRWSWALISSSWRVRRGPSPGCSRRTAAAASAPSSARWTGSATTGASSPLVSEWISGTRRNAGSPPRRRLASATDAPAATSSRASYRNSRSGRPRAARTSSLTIATAATGAVAAMRVSRSATWTQASSAQTRDGDIPALWRAVEQQQQEQDRHRGAGVVRVLEEHLGAAGDARREHDGACQQGANDARPPGGTAAGEERGQQHGQRVGERPADVHDVRPQPAKRHHEHVLGKLGGVEGDVGGPPATQQQVAVQHRLGLQDVRGAVGVERPQPRLAAGRG